MTFSRMLWPVSDRATARPKVSRAQAHVSIPEETFGQPFRRGQETRAEQRGALRDVVAGLPTVPLD